MSVEGEFLDTVIGISDSRTEIVMVRYVWGRCRHPAAGGERGCGPGAEAAVLAGAVGPGGRVYAVDADPQAVRLAAELARRSGLSQVSADVADAAATGLPAGSVDVAMIRNVLAHNGGREQKVVDHLAGLVRPGGCVYLVDADGLAVRARPADPDLEDLQSRYCGLHAARGNDIQVGLRLAELLEAAGLEVISFTGRYAIVPMPAGARGPAWAARTALIEAGMADTADVERWDAAYQRVDAAPRPQTIFAPVFIGIGRRRNDRLRGSPTVVRRPRRR